MNYKTIKIDAINEITIKKSRFICNLRRIETQEEGQNIIADIKKEHYKARHSCFAMIIGQKSEIKRFSDDGEPTGTAGIPILNVLEKKELTNVLAVVTRYFGGIKLGTGGLVRAYSGSVSEALTQTHLVEVKEQDGIEITLTYPQYQTYANFLQKEKLVELNTQFSHEVTSNIYNDSEKLKKIQQNLIEHYQGKVKIKPLEKRIIEVPIS